MKRLQDSIRRLLGARTIAAAGEATLTLTAWLRFGVARKAAAGAAVAEIEEDSYQSLSSAPAIGIHFFVFLRASAYALSLAEGCLGGKILIFNVHRRQAVPRACPSDLARQGIGLASPNPYVGAVIVDAQGKPLAGTPEATPTPARSMPKCLALEAAGSKARGGTLYINLEPHAHQGRTPPCTDALIAAGIRR